MAESGVARLWCAAGGRGQRRPLEAGPPRVRRSPRGTCSVKGDAVKRHKYQYGEDASQWGELFLPELPAGGEHRGVVVVIHGGYWRSQYGAELGSRSPRTLPPTAWPPGTLNTGGPETAGLAEHVHRRAGGNRQVARPRAKHSLNLGPVVALGHSAGGHLAAWAAGRGKLAQLGLPDADRQIPRRQGRHARCTSPALSASPAS